ncbi:MAG: AI-2E family transporter [Nannocystaceae bacterium]|nr:AI-2E family transporter [Nannocystaceae bacterium]
MATDQDQDQDHERGPLFPRWAWAIVGVLAAGYVLFALRGALTPVFFALLIAYMLDPLVDRFEERGMSRATGIGFVTVGLVLVLAAMVFLVVPGIVRETISFAAHLPETLTVLVDRLEPLLGEIGLSRPESFEDVRTQLDGVDTGVLVEKAAKQLAAVATFVLGGTVSVVAALAGLVMIPVFAAYLLYDFDRMTAGIGDLVPGRYRGYVVEVAGEVDAILGDFVRGQLLVMLALVVLYGVGYAIVGVPLALGIGVVAGMLSFIPYVGGAVALGMALLMSLLHWTGWGQIIGVGVVYTVIQLLESFLITPKVVGDKVGLPAIWVLFALLVGAELFGFLGVLLALPAAAVAKIFVIRGLAWYRSSEFFLADDPGPVDTDGAASGASAAPPQPESVAQAPDDAEDDAPDAEDAPQDRSE